VQKYIKFLLHIMFRRNILGDKTFEVLPPLASLDYGLAHGLQQLEETAIKLNCLFYHSIGSKSDVK